MDKRPTVIATPVTPPPIPNRDYKKEKNQNHNGFEADENRYSLKKFDAENVTPPLKFESPNCISYKTKAVDENYPV